MNQESLKLEKVYTNDNLADPFTKALAFPKHSEHTKNIGMLPASSLIYLVLELNGEGGSKGVLLQQWGRFSLMGIRIDESLTLSHLFHADDAIFIGLKINIHKSKLMGIGVSHEDVNAASNIIGCSTFSTPFNYLGVKVGMSSSRSKSWDEHMLIYKAPMGALHNMESFRRRFFNGVDKNEKKISMIGWKKIIIRELGTLSLQGINLLSHMKKKVGNGVHTLFWEDSWITDIPFSHTFPQLYALENEKHITIADKLSEASLIVSFRRALCGSMEEEQYIRLVDLVASVTLSNSNDSRCGYLIHRVSSRLSRPVHTLMIRYYLR
ncbi:hypothetical protein Tco_1497987 [Tanacetum coccineum]